MARKTNCVINGIEYYRIRKKVGEDENGRSIIRPFYGKSKADAEAKVKAWEDNHETGADPKAYMSQVMHYYIDEVFMKGDHAPGTKNRYKGVYEKHIKGDLVTHNRMEQINSKVIQQFLNSKTSVSVGVLNAIRKVLVLFFKYAAHEGYCRDPMPSVAKPKVNQQAKEIIVFTKEEFAKLKSGKGQMKDLVMFALGTGLRQGELRALRFSDIKDGCVNVSHQIVLDTNKRDMDSQTKTENSVRQVPIPPTLLNRVNEMAKGRDKNSLVFGTSVGTPYDKSNLIREYHKYLEEVGVPPKKFHALRSTYATLLCENGVPIQTVAKLLGNTVTVVLRYYAFVSDKVKDDAMDKIKNLF